MNYYAVKYQGNHHVDLRTLTTNKDYATHVAKKSKQGAVIELIENDKYLYFVDENNDEKYFYASDFNTKDKRIFYVEKSSIVEAKRKLKKGKLYSVEIKMDKFDNIINAVINGK